MREILTWVAFLFAGLAALLLVWWLSDKVRDSEWNQRRKAHNARIQQEREWRRS